MGLRRIDDVEWVPLPCRHPEHNPPSMIVLKPGSYEDGCPGCHMKTRFNVGPGPQLWTL